MNDHHEDNENHDGSRVTRRDFIGLTFAALSAGSILEAAAAGMPVPQRVLGRTGAKVSIIGLGGYHSAVPGDENETIKIIRTAIDSGINFMDNCWDYHGGNAESRMGKALRNGYRERVFLMTKIDGRKKAIAAKQIDECLSRLQTDHIDLMQFHELCKQSEPETIYGPNGAMEALLEARKAGKIRFIGFTGHKSPAVHNKMLDLADKNNFVFDAVQMPINVMDAHYDSFEGLVLPRLVKQNIGVLGMKPLGAGYILKTGAVTAKECLQFGISAVRENGILITGMQSMRDLHQALDAAQTYKPLSPQERAAILAKTAVLAAHGKFEPYKTTYAFDATRYHPDWTG